MPRTRTLLVHDLPGVSIDPLSHQETGTCKLPAGTCVEGATAAMTEAAAKGREHVTLRVVESGGWVALKRVAVSDLRRALGTEAC